MVSKTGVAKLREVIILMAKLIILETTSTRKIRYAMWADVPAPRQKFYVNPDFVSTFLDAGAGDLTALRSGALVERVAEEQIDGNNAQIRAVLETRLSAYQSEITAFNNWAKYGSSFDGVTWTNVVVT